MRFCFRPVAAPERSWPPTAAVQRLRPVGATKLTNGDSQEAAVEYVTRRLYEWQLYEVLRT